MDSDELEERLENFLHSNEILEELRKLSSEGKKSLVMEYDRLVETDMELAKSLLNEPSEFLSKADSILKDITEIPGSHLRIKDLDETLDVRSVRASNVGKFIQLEGILTRVSDVKPEIEVANFKCLRCGEKNKVLQTGKKFRKPQICQNPNCSKKGPFRLEEEKSEFRDWQSLRLQELPEKLRGGRVPRHLSAIARDDIVDEATPGNQVVVTGVLRAYQEKERNQKKTTFRKVLDVNHITVKEKSVEETELSSEDEEWIEELKENHRVKNLVINSIAPSIFGYEKIKEAIALQLFGSPAVELPDGSRIRGDSHILLTGDPGTAKSQLLKWTNQVAPRAIYASGKKSTGAGLCVAPDSLVMFSDGSLVEIGEFVEENLETEESDSEEIVTEKLEESKRSISLDTERLQNAQKTVDEIWKIPAPGKLIRIETKMGRELTITPENPLLVMDRDGPNWVKAENLKRGDFLAIHREVNVQDENISPLISKIEGRTYVLGVANLVDKIVDDLRKKYGTIRAAAKDLNLSEDSIYYRWRNDEVRGNPPLSKLLDLAKEVGLGIHDVAEHVDALRQPNGTTIKIPKYPDRDFMYFVGAMAADGHVGVTPRGGRDLRFFNNDKRLLEKYQEIVESLFGIKPKLIEEKSRTPCVRFFSKVVGKLLNAFGVPTGEKSHKINIPTCITSLSDDLLAAYLRGLFDCDGSVVSRKEGSSNIYYSTTSSDVAKKLQLLLLRFGILSKLRARDPRGEFYSFNDQEIRGQKRKWEVKIGGLENLSRFQENIGFFSIRKKKKLEEIIDRTSQSNPNLDVVPHAGPLVKKARKALDVSPSKVYNRTSHKLESDGMYPSRDFLSKVLNEIAPASADGGGVKEFELLEKLASSDLYWDSIKEIEVLRDHNIEYVYDFSIEDAHNFMVNGIVVHNTAAAVRDEFTGGWTLEAGALAIGDGGLACIDEFDKMSDEESGAILESMEQQTISVAKAGIVATLNTRTAILAAANPRLGRFDEFDPIPQQIDLPALILSRFDLIFILRDIPKEERDRDLANHMLRLQSEPDRVVEPDLDKEELRKLIIYARKYVNPEFKNEEVKQKLEDFFVEWRSTVGGEVSSEQSTVPITARQLEALVRLAKSNARIRLSEEVEVEDADKAIELFRTQLKQLGLEDESGKPDIDILMTGHDRTQHEKLQKIMEIIGELEEDYEEGAPIKLVKEEARAEGIEQNFVEEMIRQEKRNGRLYSPSEELIKKAT
ncbi:hypothetical protein AKJ40_01490 [candidate division MSBL1 archaeon SCGC-AAA259M10]|uniref:DNA helicase n=3 Tax=candidate division MSBL1 TaxID=215777 RepID=A0A133U7G0_9EURY|nr:hypothetical protein AKJ61_01400 [candidate division MSBL1 archaeon SCGC-AAA259B11]KXA93701.1 hypothetical protein AKJ66_01335 [candidate division MSBL1 archaeon SCGC-AAA259E22]KXB00335.1 hypothetical protein AKJ40_01490 [candidate division MSBL1 archaeon SCGC-AAA259M10]